MKSVLWNINGNAVRLKFYSNFSTAVKEFKEIIVKENKNVMENTKNKLDFYKEKNEKYNILNVLNENNKSIRKWLFLEHRGPVFAPDYERLPSNVKFLYCGEEIQLSQDAEEIACFYAKMLDHDYTTKDIFNTNFFKDWRKSMTEKERSKITDLKKCDFKQMHAYFMDVAEKNQNRTKEEKQALKEKNEAIIKEYGFCILDGHKEKLGNFKIEPPGLFRGRGEHPKMGRLKKRVVAEDIIINCSNDSNYPKPPEGHKWKEIRHDPTVTWLASWIENVQSKVKYIVLDSTSKHLFKNDIQKFETARRLHIHIDQIRKKYRKDWKSEEIKLKQVAVALYLIDKLALRAGNEKDINQVATVGCCSLRVKHIQLHREKNNKKYLVIFDFLGKDSIHYYNEVEVEKDVFLNLQTFIQNKNKEDLLFDHLNTAMLNKHLNELMEGLTTKVFRTYNASKIFEKELKKTEGYTDTKKLLCYYRANKKVAILCNHQRTVPKCYQKSIEKLKEKIENKKNTIEDAEKHLKEFEKTNEIMYTKWKRILDKLKSQLCILKFQEITKDENKTILLTTSKLNYLDPRISVAWCKKYDIPINRIFTKFQREKFKWAIEIADPDFNF